MDQYSIPQTKSKTLALKILLLFFAYAIARYVIFGSVHWSQIPIFVFNKALAAAGSVILAWVLVIGPLAKKLPKFQRLLSQRKWLGLYGSLMLGIHSIFTLVLMNSAYFPKFFLTDENKLNFSGQISILCSVFSFSIFASLAVTSFNFVRRQVGVGDWNQVHAWGPVALLSGIIHVAVISYPSWFTPEKWPLYSLPVTLIVCSTCAFALILRISLLRDKKLNAATEKSIEVPSDGGALPSLSSIGH